MGGDPRLGPLAEAQEVTQKTRAVLDFIALYFSTLLGVGCSLALGLAALPDAGRAKYGQVVVAFAIATFVVANGDYGDLEGKLKFDATRRRYIGAWSHGFTWQAASDGLLRLAEQA
mgnify:CR=1 FL=1